MRGTITIPVWLFVFLVLLSAGVNLASELIQYLGP